MSNDRVHAGCHDDEHSKHKHLAAVEVIVARAQQVRSEVGRADSHLHHQHEGSACDCGVDDRDSEQDGADTHCDFDGDVRLEGRGSLGKSLCMPQWAACWQLLDASPGYGARAIVARL